MNKKEVWIATVEVEPLAPGALPADATGAFTSILAMAEHPRDFRTQIREACAMFDLEVVDISDAEPLELRLEFADLKGEELLLSKKVARSGELAFTTMDAYIEDELED